MRPRDTKRGNQLVSKLKKFANIRSLPGVEEDAFLIALAEQMVESQRRIEFVHRIREQKLAPTRADPASDLFDPVRAAVLHARAGRLDEAFWLVFLFVHFGKSLKTGWRLARDVYGRLGGTPWTWAAVSASPDRLEKWLASNEGVLVKRGGQFGNHRKYETLSASSPAGTPHVIKSYVKWVAPPRTHGELVSAALEVDGGDPRKAFAALYDSMESVKRFGRTARFDYLTMLQKLGLALIEPGSPVLQGATGPLRGARLLFGGSVAAELSARTLEPLVVALGDYLGVGMQVMEDSLCNWQKSPAKFRAFRG